MRVLVTGGRAYDNRNRLTRALDSLHAKHPITTLIHGNAPGADTLAADWPRTRGVTAISYPANWKQHAKAAGPIRNQQMINLGKPDAVVAFPGGKGTADMLAKARAANISQIWEVDAPTPCNANRRAL
jgi:hypothetical protein